MAESTIVFDTASTLEVTSNSTTLPTYHLLDGTLPLILPTYHQSARVSRARTLPTHHQIGRILQSVSVPTYHQSEAVTRWVTGLHFLGTEGRTTVEAVDGAILETTGIGTTSSTHVLPRGVKYVRIKHGDSVVFAEPRSTVPYVFVAGGGATHQQDSTWGTRAEVDAGTATDPAPAGGAQYRAAEFAVTRTGFEARLYLRSAIATPASHVEVFASPTSITAEGGMTGTATPSSGDLPALESAFTASFAGQVTAGRAGQANLLVALDARIDGGAWQTIDTHESVRAFSASGNWNVTGHLRGTIFDFDGSGLDQFRCRVLRFEAPAPATLSLSFTGVQWFTGDVKYTSMTPSTISGIDRVTALVIEGASGD